MITDSHTASALTKECYLIEITTKPHDVSPDPIQDHGLIPVTHIPGKFTRLAVKPIPDPQPVVNADDNDIPERQSRPLIGRGCHWAKNAKGFDENIMSGSVGKASAVYEEKDG